MTKRSATATSGRPTSQGRQGLIDRHGLVSLLDQAAQMPVTIVSAPAGSGKTSLLRVWANRPGQSRHIAFLSVRPGQHDAQQFWLALLAAVRSATGTGEVEQPVARGFDGNAMVDRVLSELMDWGRPFFLVIDDLHELSSADAVEQLTRLLMSLPPDVHAIVATRRDRSLRLHRLRLVGQLAEIRDAQLRFSQEETRDLLATAGIALPEAAAAMLHQRTEGWAAGLRLAVLSLEGRADAAQFVTEFSGSDRTVAEYLMAEMLDRQPLDVQRLLLRTSFLDQVNGELADLLSGSAGAERILLDLEDANAFVVSLDADRTWFRYHHMFGDLLRLELRRTFPGDIPDLHRIAAHWFTDHSHIADAVHHLQAAGDWSQAADLLTDHAVSLTLDGRTETVSALLRAFPAQAAKDHPGLSLVQAITDLDRMCLDEAAAHLDVARSYAATTPVNRRSRLRTAIASLELLLARLRGHFDGVSELVEALPTNAASQSGAETALSSDLRAVALLNHGVVKAWLLRLADSEQDLLEGAALARDIGRPYLEVACLSYYGLASCPRSFSQARRRCEEAIALAARHGWDNNSVIAPAQVTLAGILIWTGEFDGGTHWLKRARKATERSGEPGLRVLAHLLAACVPAAHGHHHEALEELAAARRVQARMVGEHALAIRVIGWTAACQARLGMVDLARETLSDLDERQASSGEACNAAAVISLAEKDPERARHELRPVLDGTAPVNPYLTRVEANLLDALACRDLGDERAAQASIERALTIAEPDRLIFPFAMTGAWQLLDTLGPRGEAHAALIADILDMVHDGTLAAAAWAPGGPAEALSPSELRVLRLLPTNLTRPEIANELSVSLNTINTHMRRIYAKLGATDRSSAVQRSRELRLLARNRA
ncbi:LuxR C-terminal-related transcriptional regulator [Streptomyces mirabilis]|uniref:LuxR C-terminal-related transcriptional regulator n=1 Tax=Streptomyces mirabilis TaxID=68239 RepID=UPI0036C49CFC